MLSLLLSCVFAIPTLCSLIVPPIPNGAPSKRQAPPNSSLLTDFQVYEPVLTPSGPSNHYGCVYTKTLMVHDFAASYGDPFVGNYTPPPCSFNRVTMNFTVTSRGRQFDRLAIMYLGDIEVFRTSTAEPTTNGIIWTYVKEMQQYDALWQTEQKIIFDLGNLISDIYTGIFNTTLTATFFTVPDSPATADTILPISAMKSASNAPSIFQVPGDNASVAYTLPNNVNRAVVSLSACGQSTEEFWYTNVLTSEEDTFAASTGSLYGGSPWREVQLLIDGQLAGVSWPFPVIFTGGIVPGLWRPIVGIDAFDLREHEIDITPWLPLLLDGASHNFEIRVASLNDTDRVATLVDTPGSYWLVTGKIFLFLDEEDSVTTGSAPVITSPAPQFAITSVITQNATGANETLTYTTRASRQLSISSTVKTSTGSRAVTWTQNLDYNNYNSLSSQGLVQITTQTTNGSDSGDLGYQSTYQFPLTVNSSFYSAPDGSLGINATLTRGLFLGVNGASVFPSGVQNFNLSSNTPSLFDMSGGSRVPQTIRPAAQPDFSGSFLTTTQFGSAEYFSAMNSSFSFGTTEQDFTFSGTTAGSGASVELYTRHVKTVNSTVTEDEQRLVGVTYGVPTNAPKAAGTMTLMAEGRSARVVLGRGPGKTKEQLGGGS